MRVARITPRRTGTEAHMLGPLPKFNFFFFSFWATSHSRHGFPGGSVGKESVCDAGDSGDMGSGWEDPLEEGMATHSSIPAWRIPWTEPPGGLQSLGLQRVGHNWSKWAHTHTCTHAQQTWILVPWGGTEPMPSALKMQSLKHDHQGTPLPRFKSWLYQLCDLRQVNGPSLTCEMRIITPTTEDQLRM